MSRSIQEKFDSFLAQAAQTARPRQDDGGTILLSVPQGWLRWRPPTPLQRRTLEPVEEQQEQADEKDMSAVLSDDHERERRNRLAYHATWTAPRLRHVGLIGPPRLKLPTAEACDCEICNGTRQVERVLVSPGTSFLWKDDNAGPTHIGICRRGACTSFQGPASPVTGRTYQ